MASSSTSNTHITLPNTTFNSFQLNEWRMFVGRRRTNRPGLSSTHLCQASKCTYVSLGLFHPCHIVGDENHRCLGADVDVLQADVKHYCLQLEQQRMVAANLQDQLPNAVLGDVRPKVSGVGNLPSVAGSAERWTECRPQEPCCKPGEYLVRNAQRYIKLKVSARCVCL